VVFRGVQLTDGLLNKVIERPGKDNTVLDVGAVCGIKKWTPVLVSTALRHGGKKKSRWIDSGKGF
jgi:hypothetical protein